MSDKKRRPGPYLAEVLERTVRMVFDHQSEYPSQWKAIESISAKLSINHETLRQWVRRAEQLAANLGVSRSGVSNHLACLRGCGLVAATYEGRRVRYDLADPLISEALTALSQLRLGPCPAGRSCSTATTSRDESTS
jgi:DNA-binding transcriptional ArsR family regulator